jgi:hypothetical protein
MKKASITLGASGAIALTWLLIATPAYAAGDGDTDVYLNRKERLEKTKLQVFKAWARVRAQITSLKAVVVPRD